MKRKVLKILLSVILCLVLGSMSAFVAFKSSYVPTHMKEPEVTQIVDNEDIEKEPTVVIEEIVKTELELLVESSKRVNVLVFGHDGARADTMMVVSYNPDGKIVDIVSIPRDTRYYTEGYDAQAQDKLNAVFGLRGEGGGSQKLKEAVSDLLGVPIHYYVRVSYKGVAAVTNVLGGVRTKIPFLMDYDDPKASPELHIHFEPGTYNLMGQDAVGYLRWRKNNDGSDGGGDIKRIQRQQAFVMSALKKAIGFNLPKVIDKTFSYIRSDMSEQDAIYYGTDIVGIDFASIKKYTLPGDVDYIKRISYVIHDAEAVEQLMVDIYKRTSEE